MIFLGSHTRNAYKEPTAKGYNEGMSNSPKLTLKQEAFAQKFVELGNASAAYNPQVPMEIPHWLS